MKGIIIARNDWKSLMPLTANVSKPMLNFFDNPLISYPINQMKRHGINDILVLSEEENRPLQDYLKQMDQVTYLLLPRQGVTLQELAGTHKGCVLFNAVTVTDFDLQKLWNNHKSSSFDVTAVYPQQLQESYRATTDGNENQLADHTTVSQEAIFFLSHHTYRFCIKPQKELLSSFSEQNLTVQLLYEKGYYSSFSTVAEFRRFSREMLEHKQFLSEYRGPNDVILKENTFLEVGAKIKPPVYIGEHVTIRKNAEILPYSVICKNAVICESAKIEQSVISERCRIEHHATVTGAVISEGVTVRKNTHIVSGSVYSGNLQIAGSEALQDEKASQAPKNPEFNTHGILVPQENPHEFLYRLGQVCGFLFGMGIVGIFKDDSPKAQFFSHTLHAGLQSSGIALYEFPNCTLAMCKSACPFYQLKAGLYLFETQETVSVVILDQGGNVIPREMEKSIQEGLQHPPVPFSSALRKTAYVKPYQLYYISEIARRLHAKAISREVFCEISSPTVKEYLRKLATAHKVTLLSEPKQGVIRFQCNPSATQFTIYDEANHPLTPRQTETVIAALMIWENESAFVTTVHTPRAVCQYLEDHGVTPTETDAHPHQLDVALRQIPEQYYLCRDPIYLLLKMLSYLSEHNLTLTQWIATLPKSFLIEKTVTAGEHLTEAVTNLLHLAQDKQEDREPTYRFHSKKGVTTVTRQENSFTILSESMREEYAKELTDFYVKQFLKKPDKP